MLRFLGLMTVREHKNILEADRAHMKHINHCLNVDLDKALSDLYFASKNDHRDPKTGRFVKAGG